MLLLPDYWEASNMFVEKDKDQQFVAILVRNQNTLRNNKPWPATKKNYKRGGFGGVGPFPTGKQPENPKTWIDVWPFVEEGYQNQSKEKPYFVVILSPDNPQR